MCILLLIIIIVVIIILCMYVCVYIYIYICILKIKMHLFESHHFNKSGSKIHFAFVAILPTVSAALSVCAPCCVRWSSLPPGAVLGVGILTLWTLKFERKIKKVSEGNWQSAIKCSITICSHCIHHEQVKTVKAKKSGPLWCGKTQTLIHWKLRISARSWSSCCCWLSCCFRSSAIRFLVSSVAGSMRRGEFIQFNAKSSTRIYKIHETHRKNTKIRDKSRKSIKTLDKNPENRWKATKIIQSSAHWLSPHFPVAPAVPGTWHSACHDSAWPAQADGVRFPPCSRYAQQIKHNSNIWCYYILLIVLTWET